MTYFPCILLTSARNDKRQMTLLLNLRINSDIQEYLIRIFAHGTLNT